MLTIASIRTSRSKKSSYYLWDNTRQRGVGRLGVKVNPGGSKYFVYRFYKKKRVHFIMLGSATVGLSLSEARQIANELSEEMRKGKDPKQHFKAHYHVGGDEVSEQTPQLGSLRLLFESYTERMEIDGKRTFKQVHAQLQKEFFPHIDPETPACEVTTDQIKLVISKIIQRGAVTNSNRIRSYIMAAFNHGLSYDNDPRYFAQEATFGIKFNPVSPIPKQKDAERVGERFLEWDELKRFLTDLRNTYDVFPMGQDFRHLFQLCVYLGGQRPYEVITLSWAQVRWKERFIVITRTLSKNGREHTVPLNSLAYDILEEQFKISGGGKFVFPNPKDASQHMQTSSLARALTRYRTIMNFDHFAPRDLRRTCKTLMGACKINKETRDKLQNHALQDVSTRHYDRYDYFDEKLEALEVWDRRLKELLGVSPPPMRVVPDVPQFGSTKLIAQSGK